MADFFEINQAAKASRAAKTAARAAGELPEAFGKRMAKAAGGALLGGLGRGRSGGPSSAPPPTSGSPFDRLSPEQQEQMRQLLAAFQGGGSAPPEQAPEPPPPTSPFKTRGWGRHDTDATAEAAAGLPDGYSVAMDEATPAESSGIFGRIFGRSKASTQAPAAPQPSQTELGQDEFLRLNPWAREHLGDSKPTGRFRRGQ
jgi:hypothetical protein